MSRRRKFDYSDSEDTSECSESDTCTSEKSKCSSTSSFCPPPCPPCPRPKPGRPGCPGKPGKRGCDGHDGKKGPTGPRGLAGRRGQKGEKGPKGCKGDDGPKGPRGRDGPKGSRGEKGDRGKTGPTGPKGSKGSPGAGGTIKCIEIPFYGLGGPSVDQTMGPIGCTGESFTDIMSGCECISKVENVPVCVPCSTITPELDSTEPIKDIYFLARGNLDPKDNDHDVELYQSTGEAGSNDVNAPPAWEAVPFQGEFYYFERGIEPVPKTELVGCCGDEQNKGYIWWVNTGIGTRKGVRQRLKDKCGLKEGAQVIDSIFGNIFKLVKDGNRFYWEIQCNIARGDIFKCICIKFNGLGGISNPKEATIAPDLQDQTNIYFLDYGGPDADLYVSTGMPQPKFWNGPNNPLEPYYYFEDLNGIGINLGPGNYGRIWYVTPIIENTNTFNGKAVKLEILCKLNPGDKVLDSNTGRIFTLKCKDACECIFVADCEIDRGTRLISGCIEYTGLFASDGILPPVDTPGVEVGSYVLLPSPKPFLYQLIDDGGTKKWASVTDAPNEYYFSATLLNLSEFITLYYVRTEGSFNNACNVGSLTSATESEIKVEDIFRICNIKPGDKFYDCKTDTFYTFGQVLGPEEGLLGRFTWTKSCTACPSDPNGEKLKCLEIKFEGWTMKQTDFTCKPAAAGKYLLALNDGTLYKYNGVQWEVVDAVDIPDEYYYLADNSDKPGMALPCCDPDDCLQIWFDVKFPLGTKPVKVEEKCDLAANDKILDCESGVLYEFTGECWEICCDLSEIGGPTGPTGPTGPFGPTGPSGGPTGPTGPMGPEGPTGEGLLTINGVEGDGSDNIDLVNDGNVTITPKPGSNEVGLGVVFPTVFQRITGLALYTFPDGGATLFVNYVAIKFLIAGSSDMANIHFQQTGILLDAPNPTGNAATITGLNAAILPLTGHFSFGHWSNNAQADSRPVAIGDMFDFNVIWAEGGGNNNMYPNNGKAWRADDVGLVVYAWDSGVFIL